MDLTLSFFNDKLSKMIDTLRHIEWRDPRVATFGVGPLIKMGNAYRRLEVPDVWMPIKGEEPDSVIRARLHLPEVVATVTGLGIIAISLIHFL